MDDYDNVLNVWVEASTGLIKVYRGDSNMQIGTISVVRDAVGEIVIVFDFGLNKLQLSNS